MKPIAQFREKSLPLIAAMILCALPLGAQQKPVQLRGEVVTGYASTNAVDGSHLTQSVSPFGLFFDLNTYLGHPDFLSIRVQPRVNFGGEAPQAGFDGRDGVQVAAEFLRRRAFPLSFTYSNFRTDAINFGSLVGLNAVRQKSRYSDLGVSWQINARRLPRLIFFYNQSDSRNRPEIDVLPAYSSHYSTYGVRGSDHVWGWDINGEWSRSRRATDSASSILPDLTTYVFRQNINGGHVSAQRTFRKKYQISLLGGRENSKNSIDGMPLDQSRTFVRGAGFLQFSKRLNAQLDMGYDSNVDDSYQRVFGGSPPGGMTLLLRTGLSTLSASGQVRYKISRDWNVNGGLNRNRVHSRFGSNATFDGASWGANAGLGYNHSFRKGQLSAGYTVGLTRAAIANDGLGSNTLGHTLSMQYRAGRLESLEFTVLSMLSVNRVESNIFLTQKNAHTDVTLGRKIGKYTLQGGIVYQQIRSENYFDFRSHDLGFRASLDNGFINLRYARNTIDGRSIVLASLANGLVVSNPVAGLPLQTVLTSSARQMVSVGLRPWKKMQIQTNWFQLDQSLADRLRTTSDFFDVSVSYSFRLLDFQVGYTLYDQSLVGLPGVSRRSFFFRVRRSFRVF
ncbi:MAG: hypothetical protein M1453_08235 [Acidobacteria bacterium]|nr:hypothetical protein [Acidobacteriota bacterium]MCL5287965.1 hypothetical protein [Acidobacteriota bacterium]